MEGNMVDRSQYDFLGESLGKGRLVLAVIKHYLVIKSVSLVDLDREFVSYGFASNEVLKPKDKYETSQQHSRDTNKRVFDELQQDSMGNLFYISNQWSKAKLDPFLNWARDQNLHIQRLTNDDAETRTFVETSSLNQILYGPPGTGKTYHTIEAAVKAAEPSFVWDNRTELKDKYDVLVAEKRIRFVTFHQSFSYEEFVEGLKASSENGQISYQVEDGIFKQLCHYDETPVIESSTEESLSIEGRTVWKMSLGNTLHDDGDIFEHCVSNNQIRLGYGNSLDFSGCDSKQAVMAQFESNGVPSKPSDYRVTSVNTFKNIIAKGDLVIVTDGNLKFRAIAEITDGYIHDTDIEGHYVQTRAVVWHRVYEKSLPYEKVMRKKFSQMTLYQLSRSVLDMEKLQSLLLIEKDVSQRQQAEVKQSTASVARVLIIDEINRGNISKIFGDLITLIEPSKRAGAPEALSVQLPYSKESFSVPSNLHIIGTMNTADRSLAMMDTALRRRFDFVEMMPKPELLEGDLVKGIDLQTLLTTLNKRIEILYDREHMLGHAFFMPVKTLMEQGEEELAFTQLQSVFQNKVIPLLEEYFFEDWSKICLVLADNQKPESLQFVSEKTQKNTALNDLFGKGHKLDEYGQSVIQYTLADNASDVWEKANAYIGIYQTLNEKKADKEEPVNKGDLAAEEG